MVRDDAVKIRLITSCCCPQASLLLLLLVALSTYRTAVLAASSFSSTSAPIAPGQLPAVPYLPPSSAENADIGDRTQQSSRANDDNSFAQHHRQPNPNGKTVVSCGSCCFPTPQPLDSSPFVEDPNSPYRSALLRDGFYGKVVNVGGVPVVSSNDVLDAALLEAALTLAKLTSLNPTLLRILVDEVVHFVVIGRNEKLTDVPTYYPLRVDSGTDWDAFRGVGATQWLPASSCAEENFLCLEDDPYLVENICVHELSHTLAGSGGKLPISRLIDFGGGQLQSLDAKLRVLYQRNRGLWNNTYASVDHEEMWAEGVQSFYSVNNPYGPHGGDGVHNHVWDRETLERFDPDLTEVVERVFPSEITLGCPPTDFDKCDCDKMRAVCNAATEGWTKRPTGRPTLRPTIMPTNGPVETPGPTRRPSASPSQVPALSPPFAPFLVPSLTTAPSASGPSNHSGTAQNTSSNGKMGPLVQKQSWDATSSAASASLTSWHTRSDRGVAGLVLLCVRLGVAMVTMLIHLR